MKISLNWLKKYVEIPVSDEELIRLIGARLVEVEGVIDETHKYDGIKVVRVESAEKIEGTHLTLCMVNDGSAELTQVLCGAPNVREGMLAAWIAPGATVPASVKEDAPFVIGTRKMLGKYDSHGMLAAADELDFGDEHDGIAEIDPNMAKPGDALADVFGLNDLILEIENKSLTHRPDTFGLIGFAREVAGILGQKFNEPAADCSLKPDNAIDIKIEGDNICERYSAVVFEKHGEIKKKYLTLTDTLLAKSGMRPIDPIVDATNYLMLLTGQPLHAFDYDKFVAVGGSKNPKIIVRLAHAGEKMKLLDGKEITMNESDIVITSNDVPVALAGAMGGASTMIDENTKNVILESATFSLYNLRKTQMAHGIFSEAITRFTKGQPPYQTLNVAEACAGLLKDGFKISSVSDAYENKAKANVVEITTDEINRLLGTDYSEKKVVNTLTNVGFEVETGKELKVTAPAWRTDIHIKEDIIEEVGRLNGYDNITPTLPRHNSATKNKMLTLKREIRDTMKEFGANEVLTYSFVSERLLENAGVKTNNSYKIVNSISPELQLVRQSIVPSLLDKAHMNQKIPFDEFALFEMNKVYRKDLGFNDEEVPTEKMSMGFVLAERKNQGTAYYKAKMYVEKFLKRFNLEAEFKPLKTDVAEALPFEKKRAAEIYVGENYLGVVGEFRTGVKRNFKLADYLAGFEIDLDVLLSLETPKKVNNSFEIKDKQDLTITTKKTYAETLKEVREKYPEAEITPVGIYQPEGAEEENVTFHLEFR